MAHLCYCAHDDHDWRVRDLTDDDDDDNDDDDDVYDDYDDASVADNDSTVVGRPDSSVGTAFSF